MATYQNLVQDIIDYLARPDLAHKVPSFVKLAEKRIERTFRARSMEKQVKLLTVPGSDQLPLPEDFMEMREVWLETNNSHNLVYVAPDVFTDERGKSGSPKFYTVIGNSLILAPVSPSIIPVNLVYYARIEHLSEENQTNDILTGFYDLYLYAALIDSSAYARSSVPSQAWMDFYTSALVDAQSSERKARFGKQLRARAPRN